MKYVKRNVLIATIVILGLCVSSASVMAAPVAEDITITVSPSDAAPLSTITFNATVSGDYIIDEVFLALKECKDDFCYLARNLSMAEIAPGEYQVNVTLEHSDANNIGYQLVINSNGTWYDFFTPEETIYTYLTITPSDGQQDDGDGTPGFELILMLVSIAFIVFMLQRKREK